jgi:transposase
MMGRHEPQQPLFCIVDLDSGIPDCHPLRRLKQLVDFSFVRAEVAPFYGYNGQESIDPEIVLKLMVLLYLDNLPSERELMRQVGYRLDYLWFLNMSLEDAVPDHSILSKARSRWGSDVFEELFVRSVQQCVDAGLVSGEKVHLDASLVDANASKNPARTLCTRGRRR